MIQFDFDTDCCGCSACANACPVDAISMQSNVEGFLCPSVDVSKCTNCGKCERVCPRINTQTDVSKFSIDDLKDKKAFLYYLNSDARKKSASGGLIYALTKKIQSEGGIVCGCVWNDSMEAEHICSDKDADLVRMQSSKYVQSRINDCYSKIKESLIQGRKVLFCGTPCQTAGLHFYLGKTDASNLLSVSLICHGVPSPMVWNLYKEAIQQKHKGRLVDANHRDKSYKGYSESYCRYTFVENQNSQKVWNVGLPTYLSDPYIFLFTDNLYIRNSCTHCKYKADNGKADIIVGDYYASTKNAGNDGCSCVIAMTEKGNVALSQVDGVLEPTSISQAVGTNSMLWKSVSKSKLSNDFFLKISKYSVGDMSVFTDFLPFRFKVKRTLNYLGFFKYWQKAKQLKNKRKK